MRILVTGSEGFLGRHLVRELRSKGHYVFGCDLIHSIDPESARADIAEYRQVAPLFEMEFDCVYNLAAEFGRKNGQNYYEQMWRSNVVGTRNIIDLCIKHDVRLIHASSSEAYGDGWGDNHILRESDLNQKVPEFHNEYALSKYTNEHQIAIARERGLRSTTLRFFNAYGPGEYYSPYRSVVCLFIYSVLHGLPITVYLNYHRSFMYIDDWSRTVSRVCDGVCPEPVYNIAGEEYTSVEELFKIVSDYIDIPTTVSYRDKEEFQIQNKRADISLARRDLSHGCLTPLRDGIEKTIDWMVHEYPAHRWSPAKFDKTESCH